jgi:hypothetical protein
MRYFTSIRTFFGLPNIVCPLGDSLMRNCFVIVSMRSVIRFIRCPWFPRFGFSSGLACFLNGLILWHGGALPIDGSWYGLLAVRPDQL